MNDNDNRPTVPIDPAGMTRPTEPIAPDGETRPTEPIGPTTDTTDPAAWFRADDTPPVATERTPAAERKRLPARFGTIFWGVLLLVFAGFMVANAVVPFVQDPVTWLIAGLIAAGAVLVIAGIAAAVRRSE